MFSLITRHAGNHLRRTLNLGREEGHTGLHEQLPDLRVASTDSHLFGAKLCARSIGRFVIVGVIENWLHVDVNTSTKWVPRDIRRIARGRIHHNNIIY